MADVSGKFFSAKKVRTGVSPSSPGVIVGETLPPVNPPGGGLNSVGLTMPAAFAVANSPLTSNGTIEVTGAGTTAEYVRGDGSLATFPALTGFVPYTGATQNVDLGEFGVDAGFVNLDTTPTNTPTTQGTIFWDVDDETVDVVLNGYIMKIGEDQFYPVKNQTGSSIAKGTAVRFAGTVGASGRLLIAPFIADGTVSSSFFMGVTAEAIADGEDGKVLYFGRIRGINTNAFNEGDVLYASTTVAGGFQTAVPVAPNNIVQVAAVINKSINQGVIFIRPSFGSNINQDEGVKIVSPTTGQLLQLQSNGLWENKTKAQVLGGTSSQFVKGDGSLDSNVYALNSALANYQLTSEKAQPNGYASLDSNGKVPLMQINDALIGNVNFQGLWNAATNTPTLANPPASGTKGYYYIVSTAGTFAGISFEVGDWIISDGTAWGKVDNTDAVSSVFGRTGNVTATNGDYNTSQVTENTNLYYTEARVSANTDVAANTAARHNSVTLGTANGLSLSTQQLSLQLATSGQNGALSSTDWTTFNSKENAITAGTTAQYFRGDKTFQTLNTAAVPESGNLYYTEARVNANTNVAANTAARHAAVTLGTANGLSLSTQQLSLGLASAGVTGALSGTDWSTFNSKQQALNGTGFVKISGTTISYDNTSYLPLTGGTLTGALSGTSASFSGNVSLNTSFNFGSVTVGNSIFTTDSKFQHIRVSVENDLAIIRTDWFSGAGGAQRDLSLQYGLQERIRLNSTGISVTGAATFSSSVIATSFELGNGQFFRARRNFNNALINVLGFESGTDDLIQVFSENWKLRGTGGAGDEKITITSTGVATFSSTITATQFIRSGGTSSQFLKADGSVDSNSYYLASNPSAFIALTALSGTAPIQYNNTTGAISITQSSGSTNGFLSSTDWNTFNNKTSNVGTVTSVAALTLGTAGTDLSSSVANGTTTPVITLNVPTASAANRGALSAADWTTFNNKQNALTNPVTGTGTTNYLPKFTGTSTIGNSQIFDNGTNVGIGTTSVSGTYEKLAVAGGISIKDNTNAKLEIGRYNTTGAQNSYIKLGANSNSLRFTNNTDIADIMELTNSGNLGLGVTPSAWSSSWRAFEFQAAAIAWTGGGANDFSFSTNSFFDTTDSRWEYKGTGDGAARYSITALTSEHRWFNAPIGTAGNAISFTQAMTLGSNSGLSIGTPSAAPAQGLLVQGAATLSSNLAVNGNKITLGSQEDIVSTSGLLLGSGFSTIEMVGSNFAAGYGAKIEQADPGDGFTYTRLFGRANTTSWTQHFQVNNTTGAATFSSSVSATSAVFSSVVNVNGASTTEALNVNGNIMLQGTANRYIRLQSATNYYYNLSSVNDDFQILEVGSIPRLTIKYPNGNVLIGTTTDAGFKLDVNGTGRFSGNVSLNTSFNFGSVTVGNSIFTTDSKFQHIRISVESDLAIIRTDWFSGAGGAQRDLSLQYGLQERIRLNSTGISVTGAATFSSSVTATSFFESSDATIKTLVEDAYQAKGIDSVVAKLYIKNGKQELGYYAQDLEGVLPSAVSKGSDGLLNLSYREVHTAKIAYLEQKIKQLENELGRIS
jgi:hypothetical protein